jgi:hypothetical protein
LFIVYLTILLISWIRASINTMNNELERIWKEAVMAIVKCQCTVKPVYNCSQNPAVAYMILHVFISSYSLMQLNNPPVNYYVVLLKIRSTKANSSSHITLLLIP